MWGRVDLQMFVVADVILFLLDVARHHCRQIAAQAHAVVVDGVPRAAVRRRQVQLGVLQVGVLLVVGGVRRMVGPVGLHVETHGNGEHSNNNVL